LYSGIISGTREMRPLHTEDQLVDIYGTRLVVEGGSGVAWSPDSLWIAYTVSIGYVEEIKIVVGRSDGSGDVRFIQEGSLSVSPSWSPDSHYIVYSHMLPDGRVHIYRTSLQGGAPVDLSASTLGSKVGVSDWDPSWAK
jgi:Tol biopolymer transport system component